MIKNKIYNNKINKVVVKLNTTEQFVIRNVPRCNYGC